MKRTSTRKHDTGLENWYEAHLHTQKAARYVVRPSTVNNFMGFLWPASLEYFSPLNPVFLSDCVSLELMRSQPVWLVRDGVVPLLWFFKANPAPKGFKGKLLVREDLAPFVPAAWRPRVGTYRLAAHPSAKKTRKKPNALLLLGVVMESYCTIERLSLMLKRATDRTAHAPIKAFLPTRDDQLSSDRRHDFHGKFMMELVRRLGSEIEFLSWTQFESMGSLEGCEALDLNEALLCADDFMMHSALSRGATPFNHGHAPRPGGRFIELSHCHGMVVNETALSGRAWLGSDAVGAVRAGESLARIRDALRSEANLAFPWPTWFTEFGRYASRSRWS